MKNVKTEKQITIDGNEAAAWVAHQLNEVIAIYPITPASPMGEHADQWSAEGRPNLWGTVPRIIEMQSEGGAAGAIHGALQAGALTTTFTASQGLLLMIPNMYKIAAELTPAVFHVASRSLAAQALSIFGDHSDVMAVRGTGFALLCSGSVQEVMDFALIAQATTLQGRIPIVHFFDGFRTSHEIAKIRQLEQDTLHTLIDSDLIHAHRAHALSPEHPVLRGSSQNPDVYFQARETVNPWQRDFPAVVQEVMHRFAACTGRRYRLFDYTGDAQAERVIIIMGSGADTVQETVEQLNRNGEKVGLVRVRLYRPFHDSALLDALPPSTHRIAVLDRTKEPGASGEPLYKDVVTTLAQDYSNGGRFAELPQTVGGRYGLSSKEFTPGMVKAVFDELKQPRPRNGFTIGINDDVTHTSLEWDPLFHAADREDLFQGMFYGLGSDGTVSANKNSIKIIGESSRLHTQGYFVYDSRKAGAVTISHLRFGPCPIHSRYLIDADEADFVACHQPVFLERYEMLEKAKPGGVFLLNSPYAVEQVWNILPHSVQQQMIDKKLHFHSIDAYGVARKCGLGRRINTIMQTCFFAISGILPQRRAIALIKQAVEKSYRRKGKAVLESNFRAIDMTLEHLHKIPLPDETTGTLEIPPPVPADAPPFVQQVTGPIIAGHGDELPVSLLPADGSFPAGTAAFEKRNLAPEIPVWEADLCTQCGKCPFVCPHSAIRSKLFPVELTRQAPPTFKHAPVRGKDYPADHHIIYQVAPEDCTGCGLCVDICPIRDKNDPERKALNMAPPPLRKPERDNWAFFLTLPEYDRRRVKSTTLKGSMLYQPLFEFSSACSGCGETPYIKLASQLFGDRMVVANATGCSSIYGGNLPTTPWAANREGRGPAWNNSLFEDNAEFGFGLRVAIDKRREYAQELLKSLRSRIGEQLVKAILTADESSETGVHEQRERVKSLHQRLADIDTPQARELKSIAEELCRKSIWIIGGDGWAYDIGFGGLDHILAAGRDVNILVLDTEVYSNTGGQTSKATPRGAVAKFSAAGKATAKKDLARIAMDYETIYVAHIAYGAKDLQTLRAFLEAESYPGPSLIIAYSPCIAHGVDLGHNHRQQQLAVHSGHWPLFRYDPRRARQSQNPLRLDSPPPTIPYREFALTETRFSALWQTRPEHAEQLLKQAQQEVTERYQRYQQLAELE